MMHERVAEALAEDLAKRLPEFEVTAAPWADPRREWIVTVWADNGGTVVADVFHVGNAEGYLLRRAGLGPVVGRAEKATDIPDVVRGAVKP